jgi:hypothetical protein
MNFEKKSLSEIEMTDMGGQKINKTEENSEIEGWLNLINKKDFKADDWKNIIVNLRKCGLTYQEIADEISAKTGKRCGKGAIYKIEKGGQNVLFNKPREREMKENVFDFVAPEKIYKIVEMICRQNCPKNSQDFLNLKEFLLDYVFSMTDRLKNKIKDSSNPEGFLYGILRTGAFYHSKDVRRNLAYKDKIIADNLLNESESDEGDSTDSEDNYDYESAERSQITEKNEDV